METDLPRCFYAEEQHMLVHGDVWLPVGKRKIARLTCIDTRTWLVAIGPPSWDED